MNDCRRPSFWSMGDAARWELIVVSFGCWRISFFPTRAFVVSFVCVMDWPGYFGTKTSPRGREMQLWVTARAANRWPRCLQAPVGKMETRLRGAFRWIENVLFNFFSFIWSFICCYFLSSSLHNWLFSLSVFLLITDQSLKSSTSKKSNYLVDLHNQIRGFTVPLGIRDLFVSQNKTKSLNNIIFAHWHCFVKC